MTATEEEDSIADSTQRVHVDRILSVLGARGRYQYLQLFVAVLIAFPDCFQLMDNIFIIRAVPHHCAAPSNDSSFWTKYQNYDNASITYKECEITVSSNGSVVETDECIAGVDFDWPTEYSVESEFNLVCDDASLTNLAQTLVIAGQGVGAFLITIFSDRFGRKIALIGSHFGLLVTGLGITFAPNFISFAIFKFIVGGFQQGVLTSMNTLSLELFPQRDRRIIALARGIFWATANVTMPLWAYLLRYESWRWLQLALTLTSLPVFYQMWYLDESLRWLVANGKTEAALKVIKRAAHTNKKDYETILKEFQIIPDTKNKDDLSIPMEVSTVTDAKSSSGSSNGQIGKKPIQITATKKMSIIDVLRVKRLLVNSLTIWFAWFMVALGYFALYLNATSLSGNPYINFFLVALMAYPANICMFFGINRFGRKTMLVLFFGLQGGGLIVMGISAYLEEYNKEVFSKLTIAAAMVGVFGAAGAFDHVFFYTPEMFPTNLRNQALGTSSLIGRFGGMIAPYTSVLSEYVVWAPSVVMGVLSILVCVLGALILPETKKRELPQTVEDLQAWYEDKDTTKANEDKDTTKTGVDKTSQDTRY